MVPEIGEAEASEASEVTRRTGGGRGRLVRQVLAVSPVYVLQLCYGMTSSYPAVTTPQLVANCSARVSFRLTSDQESWIVAMDSIISPLTSILSGHLQTSVGPRSVLLLTCVPYCLSWVCAGLSGLYNQLSLLYLSRILAGAGYGFLATTVYTVEVVSKEARGSILVFAGVTRSVGTISVYILGSVMDWYRIAFIGLVFPLVALLLLLQSPESPVYLVARGRLQEAERAIRRLNGDSHDPSADIKDIQTSMENANTRQQSRETSKIIKNIHKYPEIYKPFLIIFFLSFIQQFSGATVIRGYVVKIFGEVFTTNSSSSSDLVCPGPSLAASLGQPPYLSATILGVIRLLTSLLLTWLLLLVSRRSMFLASALGTVASLALFASILLVSDNLDTWGLSIYPKTLSWLSLISASGLVFAANLGVQPLPLLLSSELYPPDIRAFCKGVSRSLCCLLIVISLKLFPVLASALELSGTFYLYGIIVLTGLPLVMWVMPETKDLSIHQINNLFKDDNILVNEDEEP